jgi:hypothetical protein
MIISWLVFPFYLMFASQATWKYGVILSFANMLFLVDLKIDQWKLQLKLSSPYDMFEQKS